MCFTWYLLFTDLNTSFINTSLITFLWNCLIFSCVLMLYPSLFSHTGCYWLDLAPVCCELPIPSQNLLLLALTHVYLISLLSTYLYSHHSRFMCSLSTYSTRPLTLLSLLLSLLSLLITFIYSLFYFCPTDSCSLSFILPNSYLFVLTFML